MHHLIKKDFLIQKKSVILSLFIMIFFSFTLAPMGSAGLMVSVLAICYTLVYGAGTQEDKTSSDRMLISLPIKKETIVLAKYISVYVFAAYAILVNGLIRLAANALQIPNFSYPFSTEGIFWAVAAVTVLFSLSFPMIFKIGYMKSRMVNMLILFVFIFAGTSLLSKLFSDGDASQFITKYETLILFAGMILMLAVSYRISLGFYRNREF